MQTLQQRISKLFAAALTLESAARTALPHLPPEERARLELSLKRFGTVVKAIRKL